MIWSVEALTYLVVLQSVHADLSGRLLILAAMLMMVMVNLGALIPATPGNIGTFQVFAVLALSVFGVPTVVALAAAILAHIVQYVLVTAAGLMFLARESMGWSDVTHAGAEVEEVPLGAAERLGVLEP